MLSNAFISQQRKKLIDMQRYYQYQSLGNNEAVNISNKKIILRQIRTALDMIENGDYGCCDDCNELILIQRLDKVPHATRCAACQERYEKSNKRSSNFQVPSDKKIF